MRRATPPGLAKPVAVLAWSFVSPMPTAHVSPVSARTRALSARGQGLGIVAGRPDEGLVPAPDLDDDGEAAQRGHHLLRRGVVGGPVGREEHGVRAPPGGRGERHARAHPEGACLVRRRRHDLARAGRVRRRRRRRPGGRPARAGAGPPPRPGTGRGRRGGSSHARGHPRHPRSRCSPAGVRRRVRAHPTEAGCARTQAVGQPLMSEPSGATTNQFPPVPWPLVCPGAVSPENV